MKTTVVLEITHSKDIPDLADKAAARTYTLDGVDNAEVISATKAPEGLLASLRNLVKEWQS